MTKFNDALNPWDDNNDWVKLNDSLAEADDYRDVYDDLGDYDEYGRNIDLADLTGRWMVISAHAAKVHAACQTHGLDDATATLIVSRFVEEFKR